MQWLTMLTTMGGLSSDSATNFGMNTFFAAYFLQFKHFRTPLAWQKSLLLW